MIEKIIEYSIRNRFIVLVLAAALTVWGIYAVLTTPVDAIPDLSENQVVVFTDWMGRSPREIEDQITYPLSRKLQGLAGVKAVRSSSEFNFSMITIIFEDNIDFYFARQRVTERLAEANTYLPSGAVPYMAPDATALGQIFWYTVEASPSHPVDPPRLWALNKFYIIPQLTSAPGVAQVATVGGAPLEYQIDVRPETLRAYGITLSELYAAVAKSNMPAGGGVVQKNNAEYIVRGVGWLGATKGEEELDFEALKTRAIRDIENTVIKEVNGTPIYVKSLATVQLGTQFRRSVFEKDGNEVVGGVVLMRHGENPLAVTDRVKAQIQELQPGLPPGVRVIPAYDRTRLINGAIHTLSEVMWHEMLIASVAILLILWHVRSVFVICVTLPLSVLFSFLLMWFLRRLGVIDIQANIMSLAGITISIGILVDQAIVMTENATHRLKEHFGDRKVTGDIRDLVIPACRLVGRPIFFSVMIMLLSFIPVFMLSGRGGKYFHPLAFTKSFAMIGVAIISVTVVPALIPTFIRGRLRSEDENWIVRSFINIYKPLLTWALPRRNLVMWMFAVLLVLAAGMFPLQVLFPLQAIFSMSSETAWQILFLIVFAIVTALTVFLTTGTRGHGDLMFLGIAVLLFLVSLPFFWLAVHFNSVLVHFRGIAVPFGWFVVRLLPAGNVAVLWWLFSLVGTIPLIGLLLLAFRTNRDVLWKAVALISLVGIAFSAYGFRKIGGGELIPPLDEGSIMDMPVTVPRASVTQAADDLKHRDGLLRGFPEVESVIGKAGRADTPTDPAPLDMVETFVNFRPKELWPKRVLTFKDAAQQTRDVLQALEQGGYVLRAPYEDDREGLVNDATQKALLRFDESMRELASLRYGEIERAIGASLTRFVVAETIRRMDQAGDLAWPKDVEAETVIEDLTLKFKPDYGRWLVKNPALEDASKLTLDIARHLADLNALRKEFRLTEQSFRALERDRVPADVVSRLRTLADKRFATEGEFLRELRKHLPREEVERHRTELVRAALVQIEPATALALKNPFRAHRTALLIVLAGVTALILVLVVVLRWQAATVGSFVVVLIAFLGLFWSGYLGVNHFHYLASQTAEIFGANPRTFAGELLREVHDQRAARWHERVKETNWELHDRGTEAYTWYALEECVQGAKGSALLGGAPHGAESERFAAEALNVQLDKGQENEAFQPFGALREELEKPFKERVFLWTRQGGKVGDLVADEMDRVLKVPGWSNIFTMPIINRIDMLSTGVRTDIGVKVFGPDLATVDRICKDIETVLKPVPGASDTIASPIMGKGYLQIDIDREKAARYGITVEDIQNEIEVALGGRVITHTVENLDRFPVRVRYARANREDEVAVRRLLVSPGSMSASRATGNSMATATGMATSASASKDGHQTDGHEAAPAHTVKAKPLVPLSAVADVRIVEGPAMIKSENGRLMNTVTLNVRGRDMLGFVDEAQRVVAQQVQLPEGVSISWSGEFEHQVRAARTLVFVFPAVILVIFVILYLTYKDLADAALMMLAVPEALAGGIFFLWLFPKIRLGWDAPPWDFTLAVWIGFIACFGMATETGIIMLVYLREAIEKRGGLEKMKSLEELRQAVIEGAVHRLRPKLLTEGVAIIAIFPMVFATGVGGEILAPMALPVLGGLLIADEVVDIFLPVRFYWVRRARWLKLQKARGEAGGQAD